MPSIFEEQAPAWSKGESVLCQQLNIHIHLRIEERAPAWSKGESVLFQQLICTLICRFAFSKAVCSSLVTQHKIRGLYHVFMHALCWHIIFKIIHMRKFAAASLLNTISDGHVIVHTCVVLACNIPIIHKFTYMNTFMHQSMRLRIEAQT